MSYSYRSVIDGGADSDMIFYNANIVATQTTATESNSSPPAVRFQETRDSPIVRDASQYYFSIIRFAMSGPNKNLPLFIPLIQTNGFNTPNQSDPNLTIYTLAIAYQREWWYTDVLGATNSTVFTATPRSTPVRYISETQNIAVAPVPFVPPSGITKQDINSRYYWVYTYKHFASLVNNAFLEAMNEVWLDLQSQWALNISIDQAVSPFPYLNDFAGFLAAHDVPFIKYNEETQLFDIYGDTRAFNISGQVDGNVDPLTNLPTGTQEALPAWVSPAAPVAPSAAVAKSTPYLRLFFNSNLFGLFTNFNNTYLGAQSGQKIEFPLTGPTAITLPVNQPAVPTADYTTEILFTNQQYTNILNNNPFLQNQSQSTAPPNFNIQCLIPSVNQQLYWIARQDYCSTGSLWSPIASLVFTSTLIPVKNEYTGAIQSLNSFGSTQTAPSNAAFQPIITDTVLDLATVKADGWRDFVLYEPSAEYKLSSLTASHEEIRNLDIQIFWKYRLTGELIPVTMYNCSDVSIKMMFRKINYRS